jgi:hypothetical protein
MNIFIDLLKQRGSLESDLTDPEDEPPRKKTCITTKPPPTAQRTLKKRPARKSSRHAFSSYLSFNSDLALSLLIMYCCFLSVLPVLLLLSTLSVLLLSLRAICIPAFC